MSGEGALKGETGIGRVLVTGGAGFIGSHVVKALTNARLRVVVFDSLSTGSEQNLGLEGRSNLEFIRGDILDGGKLSEALRSVDSVVHLAAQVSVQESVRNPAFTYKVNVDGTKNLLNESLESGIKKFVFASTCAVYGDSRRLPITEGSPRRPLSPYADSKVKAEKACRSLARGFARGLTILRFFNVYGPRQERSAYANVITKFVGRLSADRKLVTYGDGRQTRDFVHVHDVADAILLALKRDGTTDVYNVGSGRETSVNGLAKMMSDIVGPDARGLVHAQSKGGEVRRSWADVSKARDVLEFSAKVSLEEGLRGILKD
ncbi:MAG TPA: NAD-dependent epimerase/dehydratase family protein [Nitrospira sp.]|nr:NAD-dependent epimerase/dehydratase family protein [Nitrospira sp.]